MKVVVEFDMVDMSIHKHVTFFQHLLRKYQAGIRSIKIIEPDEHKIERPEWPRSDDGQDRTG